MRFDLPTDEWRGLLTPVIPHAGTDDDLPALRKVRIEVGQVAYAAATDRYTIGVSRQVLDDVPGDVAIGVEAAELSAMLRLFPCSKQSNPKLKIIIDKVPVPTGRDDVNATGLGLTVESENGTQVILHDTRDLLEGDPAAGWRTRLGRLMYRQLAPATPSLLLTADYFGRWAKAVRGLERLVFLAGPGPLDPILVLVEDHFVGAWQPAGQLDARAADLLTASPWRAATSAPDDEEENAA